MKSRTKLCLVACATLAAIAALVFAGLGPTRAAPAHQATQPSHYQVTAGWGNDDYAANIYTPQKLNVYVGDTVTWHVGGRLEPHTVTFGPMSMLRKLAKQIVTVTPQKGGPPQLALNSMAGNRTQRTTYNGMGYANSGFLFAAPPFNRPYSLTFTRPGVYHYYCLVHFPDMVGTVVVHPRPQMTHTYYVHTGYEYGTGGADAFFPETLTVHVGDSVVWYGAIFHTVTFAPRTVVQSLRRQFIVPVAQKSGPPRLTINPRVAFPTGGASYNGTGIVSSGILQPPHKTYRLTFTKAGMYYYGCLIHPGMDGMIRVVP